MHSYVKNGQIQNLKKNMQIQNFKILGKEKKYGNMQVDLGLLYGM